MHYTEIIETIKSRRIALHVNQETLSLLSGVGLRTLKEIESGKGNPTLSTIQKLADALGLDLCFKVKDLSGN
jgi:transcriptional regulator with XRE-family HTH domain